MLKAMLVCIAIACQSTLASNFNDEDNKGKIDVCDMSINYLKAPIYYFPSCKSLRDYGKAFIVVGGSIAVHALAAYICLSEPKETCRSIGGVLWISNGCLSICGILGRVLWVNETRKSHPELAAILDSLFNKQALATQPTNENPNEYTPLLVEENEIIGHVTKILNTYFTDDKKPKVEDLVQRFRAATLAGYFLPEDTLPGMDTLGFVGKWKNESIEDLLELLYREQFFQMAKAHRKKLDNFIGTSPRSI